MSRTILKLAGVAATALLTSIGVALPAHASVPTPTSHWAFDGNANDEFSNSILELAPECPVSGTDICNDSLSYSTDANGGYMQWATTESYGGGFTVYTDGDIGSSYTFGMKFAIDTASVDPGGYSKLVDYRDRGPDTGFYFYGEQPYLNFYDLETSDESFAYGDVLDIYAVRDASGVSPTFTVYVLTNGEWVEAFSIDDASGEADPAEYLADSVLGFFHDDTDTSDEGPQAGRIYDLKIWQNVALTADQVHSAAEADESAPEALADTGLSSIDLYSALWASLLLLVGGASTLRFRRRF